MPIGTVKQLCTPSSVVTSTSASEQVAQLEHFEKLKGDATEFFRRNHFTDGLKRLVERGMERLAGNTSEGAFYLTQAMGGGKTHSLLTLGLLAADPALRRQVLPGSTAGASFGPAKVVIFSGLQSPSNLLWGHIADGLGKPSVMAPFWENGPKVPGVSEWADLLGDEPVLVLIDELPSYLRVTQGQAVGNSTLGEQTILGLERLFNALERCPRACVVVTNLKDDIYLDGSTQLKTLIESLSKHADRNAESITPVQQNTSEVFEIVRKRLFDALPPADKIDEVAQAYVAALQRARRVDTIPTTPETFIERIRETYPFHPSIRDIVARFAENRGYQKTRALIRILRLAVKSALNGDGNAFLVGLQHLDFNDQATQEELRKINPYYVNAISRDVASRGSALAERVDKMDGNPTASSVAKILLMSSLSTAESPLRGLTEGELIESLVDPLLEVSEIKSALGRLQGQAWYMFQGVDQRIFFGQNANVTAEITEVAQNIADELVDQSLRDKLKEVFKPRTGNLYSDRMAILPGLDEIELDDERPTLIILERPADQLPTDFDEWWKKQDAQNRVLVLTADPNTVTTLRGNARRARAIELVKRRI
ncbi:MAG: ATP-binding protein, partial [Planctomycetales bacterium]|nr:ATP-binding protein [Planctomycetales bacterium]